MSEKETAPAVLEHPEARTTKGYFMANATIAQPAHPSTPIEQIAEAVEAEFERLKAARPALLSRISRAENILVTHLSCKRAGIIRPRVRGGELVAYLVKGSGGAVYRVEPGNFSCSCPDYHRSNLKGCKHGIACYALGRAFRPDPGYHGTHQGVGRRCMAEPKITRHVAELAGEGTATVAVPKTITAESTTVDSYGPTACSRCFEGMTYDGQTGEWVDCERCSGTGRVLAFLYSRAQRRLAECVGCGERYPHRELVEVTEDHESLTWFVGDKLCRGEAGCAGANGVL